MDENNYWTNLRRRRLSRRGLLGASAVAGAGLAGISLVGCGDDDDDDDDGGDGAKAPAKGDSTGVTATEIKVGALFAQSGDVGTQFVPFGSGVKARFGLENDKGGFDGRKLVYESADDGNTIPRNLQAGKDLVENKGVFAILEATPSTEGSGDYLKEKGVPVFGWALGEEWNTHPNMFPYGGGAGPNEKVYATTAAKFLKEQGVTKMASIGFSNPESALSAKLTAEAAKKVGMEAAYTRIDVPFGSTDYTADVQKMKAAGVDGLYAAMIVQSNVALYTACVQGGLKVKAIFPTGYDRRLVAALGEQLEGVYFLAGFVPLELNTAASKTVIDALVKYSQVEQADQVSISGWLSADLFIRGLQEAKKAGANPPTRQAVIDGLRKVKDYDANGLIPTVDFSAGPGIPLACSYIVQVKNKAFVPVSDKPICGEIVKRS